MSVSDKASKQLNKALEELFGTGRKYELHFGTLTISVSVQRSSFFPLRLFPDIRNILCILASSNQRKSVHVLDAAQKVVMIVLLVAG